MIAEKVNTNKPIKTSIKNKNHEILLISQQSRLAGSAKEIRYAESKGE